MTDNITTPIASSTKFKTKDTGADGHMPAHILFDSAEGEILGTKTDAAATATDATATSAMSVWKQISASIQSVAGIVGSSKAAVKAASGDFADGAIATLGAKTDAKSTATDGTSVSVMQVAKQISASLQGILASAHETSEISNAGTALTPKFAKISASGSGANTVVAAVTGKKIRVLAWDLMPNAAVNAKWQSHVTPTDLTGLYYMSAQGNGVARAFNPVGYFETVAGEALDINLSASVAVGGCLTYVEV